MPLFHQQYSIVTTCCLNSTLSNIKHGSCLEENLFIELLLFCYQVVCGVIA